jgi:hypothetical protein
MCVCVCVCVCVWVGGLRYVCVRIVCACDIDGVVCVGVCVCACVHGGSVCVSGRGTCFNGMWLPQWLFSTEFVGA